MLVSRQQTADSRQQTADSRQIKSAFPMYLLQRLKHYFLAPRFHFNRLQFNLVTFLFICIGLLVGSYLTAKNIIPKIFATTQASITVDTDTDFNKGTLSSTQVSGSGSAAVVQLNGGSISPAWYNNSWTYRKSITIDHTKVSANQTNFPVLISISSDSNLASNALSSGNDILFTSSDGTTKLNHEIESYNSSTGQLNAWVNVSSLSSTADTVLYMYYGNSGVSNQQNKTGVWNSNYKLVYHFDESSGSTVNDSTSNGTNGTATGTTIVSGKFSNARGFSGNTNYITTTLTNGSTMTVSAWATHSGDSDMLFNKQSGTGPDLFFYSGKISWNTWNGANNPFCNEPSTINDGNYHLYTVVVSSGNTALYYDGALCGTATYADPSGSFNISSNAGYDWHGNIDEMRVSNNALSSSWIATEYNNQNSPSTFISVGSQTINLASSGTWESASNSNVIDLVWNGGWGDGSTGTSTAFSATVASVSAGQTVAFQMRTAATTTALTSASYVTLGTANSGTTFTQTKSQLDALGLGTGTNRYIQVKVTFSQTTGISPTLDNFTIYYAKDNTAPETNATSPLMYTSNGGTSIASSGWDNVSTPYFTWTAGSDSQSGIKGYCLYLGTSNTVVPSTNSPGDLSASNSPVSASGTSCDGGGGFIVSSTSVDLSTSGYIGTALSSSTSPYYLGVAAVDNAGNVDSSFTFFTFYYDNTAPTNVAYTSCAGGNFSNVTDMNFSWPTSGTSASSDSNSGVLGWQYQINSSTGTWQGTTHTATLNLDYIPATASAYTLVSSRDSSAIVSGANIVYFRTVDTAGNISSSSTYRTCSLSYGGAAPTFPGNGTVTITPSSSTTNSFALSWPVATATTGQTVTHYYYMINNSPPSTLSTLQGNATTYIDNGTTLTVAAKALANVNKGTNTIYVVAIDNASTPNYSPSNDITGTFTLNSTNPDPVQNLLASDSSIKSTSTWNVTLTWTAGSYQGAGNLTYNVYRSTDDVTFSKVGSTSGLSYVDNTPSSTLYYYYVVTEDGANATSANSTTVSITPTGKYTSPPTLQSGPTVSGITTQQATIAWSTDRNGDSKVAYGTTSGSYGTTQPYVSTQVTSHSVALTNLTPGTTYYYKVSWTDTDGNTGTSTEYNFTTSPPPTVSGVKATNISLSSAYITFTITNATKATIQYGLTTSYGGSQTVSTATNQSTYSVPLTNLLDGTYYHYRIVMEDASGTQYNSDDYTDLVTLPRPKISSIGIAEVAGTAQPTVLVSWTTNTEISSIVTYYPLGNSQAAHDEVNVALTKGEHEIFLKGLDPKTTYQMLVKGRDIVGNEALSDVQTFTTATDTRPPELSEVQVEGSVLPSGSNSQQVAQLVVTWNSDKPATSQVEFGEGTGTTYSEKTQQDGNDTFNHLVIISNLTPSKVYHLRAISVDKYGNVGKSIDTVTIAPKATDNALNLVITNLEQAFGISGGGQ